MQGSAVQRPRSFEAGDSRRLRGRVKNACFQNNTREYILKAPELPVVCTKQTD